MEREECLECDNCGHEINESDKYCKNCGSKCKEVQEDGRGRSRERSGRKRKVSEFLEALKLKTSKGRRKSEPQSSRKRDYKKFELGWVHYDDRHWSLIPERRGGGTRLVSFPWNTGYSEILNKAISLFFPDGTSIFGNIDDMNAKLTRHHTEKSLILLDIEGSRKPFTLERFKDMLQIDKIRIYLRTQERDTLTDTDSGSGNPPGDSDSSDLPELTHSTRSKRHRDDRNQAKRHLSIAKSCVDNNDDACSDLPDILNTVSHSTRSDNSRRGARADQNQAGSPLSLVIHSDDDDFPDLPDPHTTRSDNRRQGAMDDQLKAGKLLSLSVVRTGPDHEHGNAGPAVPRVSNQVNTRCPGYSVHSSSIGSNEAGNGQAVFASGEATAKLSDLGNCSTPFICTNRCDMRQCPICYFFFESSYIKFHVDQCLPKLNHTNKTLNMPIMTLEELPDLETSIDELDMEILGSREPTTTEPHVKKQAVKNPDVREPDVKDADVKEPVVQEADMKAPGVKDADCYMKEPDVNDPNAKNLNVNDEKDIDMSDRRVPAKETAESNKTIECLVDRAISDLGHIQNPNTFWDSYRNLYLGGGQLEHSLDEFNCGIVVSRDFILETSIEEVLSLRNLRLPLNVVFYAEEADDEGGPTREFFRVTLQAIQKELFEMGHLTNNPAQLKDNLYYFAGIVVGLSVIHGCEVLRMEYDLLSVDPDHQFTEAELQFRTGLDRIGIISIIKRKPESALFFQQTESQLVTFRRLINLIKVSFSEVGSNMRRAEEKVYSIFIAYLREVAGGRRGNINLGSVLAFITGSVVVPVFGFPDNVMIEFAGGNALPTAGTCGCTMILPKYEGERREQVFSKFDYAFSSEYFGQL